jgi:hypothetical protein
VGLDKVGKAELIKGSSAQARGLIDSKVMSKSLFIPDDVDY